MVTWGEFASAEPAIARDGRRLFQRVGRGRALLITVRGDAPPRAHPISVDVVGDGLYAFILPSPKLEDLQQDGRYALHAHFDPAAPDEFVIRGRVRAVDEATRVAIAADWAWSVGTARAFEFLIDDALYGARPTDDDWPPKYSTWSALGG